MYSEKDPIVAKSSAAGLGGIGVVRMSGSREALQAISQNLFLGKTLEPRRATLLSVKDSKDDLIDRAIVIYFVGPHSYTGEDVLEIQAHGGIAVQQMIMDRCLEIGKSVGLRQANPGEFSERAFINGRMDLAQAEAVADLIEASSQAAARAAARSMQGEFSKKIHEINNKLLELRAYIEASMDFPEEEIEFIQAGHVIEKNKEIFELLCDLQKSALRGKVLRDGLTVVLVGPPNVGKSSLMNALAGDEVAIVTEVAGTTRDRISYPISLDGLTINLIDTAGVRETQDKVEQIGIERTLKAVEDADVVLHLSSADEIDSCAEQQALRLIYPRLREGVEFVQVINKIDLENHRRNDVKDGIRLSAKTGVGIETLINKLKELAGVSDVGQGDFLARTRHLDCLARALEHVEIVMQGKIGETMGLEIAAEEFRLASSALGEIVGETAADDLLGIIFSKFCIGK